MVIHLQPAHCCIIRINTLTKDSFHLVNQLSLPDNQLFSKGHYSVNCTIILCVLAMPSLQIQVVNSQTAICYWCRFNPSVTNKHHKAFYCPNQSQQGIRPLFPSSSQALTLASMVLTVDPCGYTYCLYGTLTIVTCIYKIYCSEYLSCHCLFINCICTYLPACLTTATMLETKRSSIQPPLYTTITNSPVTSM